MGIQITIRDVPKEVRDELAARAAAQGRSMQEFLRGELERLASRPTIESWLQGVRSSKKATGRRIAASSIVRHISADRRR